MSGLFFVSSLLLYYLEKRLDNQYSIDQILSTLREMDFIRYEGKGYQPIYTRTKLTDDLHNAFNFCTSKQIIPTKKMRNICSQTKKWCCNMHSWNIKKSYKPLFMRSVGLLCWFSCQRQDYKLQVLFYIFFNFLFQFFFNSFPFSLTSTSFSPL